jgi:rare lipoprotein A (peptidoglycan hydrolase)
MPEGAMKNKLILTALLIVAAGCAPLSKGRVAYDVGGKEMGVASWYGAEFHGRVAANGERFDMYAVSAAHRTLPLGSIVRIVNVRNGKHLFVAITDRGPYIPGRMLDLSFAAAQKLGMAEEGVAPVYLEVSDPYRMFRDEHHLSLLVSSQSAEQRASLAPHSPESPWSPADVPNRRSRRYRLLVEHDERERAVIGVPPFQTFHAGADEDV